MSKHRMRLLGALAAAGLLVPGHAAFGQASPVELLSNPSFELPVDPTFGPPPTGWTIGPPEPSVVNYAWLQPIWDLQGDNPDGDQIAALFGNCQQQVGVLEADKVYEFRFWVYFRSEQQFFGDLTTSPWGSALLRFSYDPVTETAENMPNPVPVDQWLEFSGTIDTSLPAFAGLVGQPLYAHFWSTTSANDILLDDASLTVQDSTGPEPVDYFVSSSTGSDANDGLSPESAWATFAPLAPLTLAPGSSVNLRRGDTWPASKLVLEGKGTPGNRIRLTAYGEGPNPIITGINDTTEPAVVINNPSHWEIDSLDLREAKIGLYLRFAGGNSDGTGAMFGNQDILVSHCHFQDIDFEWSDAAGNIQVVEPFELSWGAGIWIGGNIPAPPGDPNAPSVLATVLDGLTVRHCSFQTVQTGVGNGWYFPPVNRSRMRNIVLEDSWVTGCSNGSFALFEVDGAEIRRWDTWEGGTMFFTGGTTASFLQDTIGVLVEDSEFAFNNRIQTGADGTGVDFEGNTLDSVFRHNVLHNNDGSGILVLPTNGNNINLRMESNTLWNNARNPATSGQNNEARASNNSHSGQFLNNGIYLGTNINPPGGLSVYNNTTTWNNRFGANTGGNRTATSWSTVAGRPTAWDFGSGVQGWGNTNDWGGFAASGGALVGTSTGNDPYVESAPTWVNTRERRWVLVTMSQTAGDFGQVFFQTETDPTWTPAKSATFPIIADGQMRSYIVDMSQSAEYRGVVTRWRLDPTEASGSEMAIDGFSARLDPFIKGVAPIAPNEVEVVFNMAMLPGGGVFDPSSYTISGAAQGSLAPNPDTVTQLPTPNGPVYRLRWHSGATGAGEATITVDGAANARGHAIGSVPVASSVSFEAIPGDTSVPDWIQLDR